MSDLAPIGPELGRRNRRLIAERCGWPDGAVQACEDVEGSHPGWAVCWLPENTIRGFERPSGFYAVNRMDWRRQRHAYGADAETLATQIAAKAVSTSWRDCSPPACIPR